MRRLVIAAALLLSGCATVPKVDCATAAKARAAAMLAVTAIDRLCPRP